MTNEIRFNVTQPNSTAQQNGVKPQQNTGFSSDLNQQIKPNHEMSEGDTFTSTQKQPWEGKQLRDAKGDVNHKLQDDQPIFLEDMDNPFEKQCAQIADVNGNGEIDDNEKAVFGQLVGNANLDYSGQNLGETQVGGANLNINELKQLSFDKEKGEYTATFKSWAQKKYIEGQKGQLEGNLIDLSIHDFTLEDIEFWNQPETRMGREIDMNTEYEGNAM